MSKRKQLYEAVQALEAKLGQQDRIIRGYTSMNTRSLLNPAIINSANYQTVLAVGDKIQACSRYITDIPELELPSNKLEQLWYLHGSLCFYRENGRPYVAMYSKEGDLNKLGDLTTVSPIDFAGVKHRQRKTVVYDTTLTKDPCVIINDYSGTYHEGNIIPRASLNNVSIEDQAEVYAQLKNSILLTAKKAIVLLESETQRSALERTVTDFLTNNSPVIGVVAEQIGKVFQAHNLDTKLDIEGYMRAIEAYERLRANFNGIKTRSATEKKERLITSEAENDNLLTEIYLYDGLVNRQIGIELMLKHAIIKTGSVKINPLLERKEEKSTSVEKGGDDASNS